MKKQDIFEELEDVEFTFDTDAFKAPALHCDGCGREMRKKQIEMALEDKFLKVSLNVFRCAHCNTEYLNFEEARKLDKALVLSRLMNNRGFTIKKSLSFDGDNYIFRVPVDIARNLGKDACVEISPLSSRDMLVHLGKKSRF